ILRHRPSRRPPRADVTAPTVFQLRRKCAATAVQFSSRAKAATATCNSTLAPPASGAGKPAHRVIEHQPPAAESRRQWYAVQLPPECSADRWGGDKVTRWSWYARTRAGPGRSSARLGPRLALESPTLGNRQAG